MSRRPRADVVRACARLAAEETEPLLDLAPLAGASPKTLERWIVQGKRGVHLDGKRDPRRGWVSSRPALKRFLAHFASGQDPGDVPASQEAAGVC
jgi:hypothetical protein